MPRTSSPKGRLASKKTSKKPTKPKREPKLKVFCGITQPIPKGYRLGSMKECLESKQVRYYGLKKIDNKLADSINNKKDSKKDIMLKVAGLRGKLSKLKKDIDASKNAEMKKKLIGDFEKVRKEIITLNDKLKKME